MNDAALAERAWRAGDAIAAIAAADRALAAATEPRAAGVAAAAAAADGALGDATARWRGVAEMVDGVAAVEARGRAALTAALAGDRDAAAAELGRARGGLAHPAPRGVAVLLNGVQAVLDAVGGDLAGAATRLAGLAAATVPPDPFAVEPWPDLAVEVVLASGDDDTARAMLAAHDSPPGLRRLLLAAWLDLRAGRFAEARAGLAAAAGRPALRRDALLAAAVSAGLARRTTDPALVARTWHRIAPVVAGADVEILLVDVWGELSVSAATVAAPAAAAIAAGIDGVIERAGRPAWAVASGSWWQVQRAAATGSACAAPATIPGGSAYLDATAAGVRAWVEVLGGRVDPTAVREAGDRLVAAGRPWEAAALCAAAARRTDDPAATRELLGAGRGWRGRGGRDRGAGPDGLSEREREIGRLILDGHTHREIGARLYISPKTVEQHVARLRQKLSVAGRAELMSALRSRL
ncbi:regulatory LuxR family protein [Pseudonocardia hierapolitana]|uniref:Regulatory LuxR family protein n=1 Tax=Pseudonocardia hierapolitana TaxID=1128676 RepID=A0A561SX87_9PSEU|nr:helix-turn-helix transcriptional regulator [Pseudonocardia hierapolitana]TWF79482.1 regulatory LuxR family protein [Pseudonocardia hierapolitana]